ncbi:MAG: hypothetical protein DRI84_01645 [Bacteroidetes bacterium]|nr:MAG: hypothetical protein DRI84_01645 [Bacteroidota bacterium]
MKLFRMLKKILIILFISLSYSFAFGQNISGNAGGRSAAMGQTGVASSDFWSVNNNQAGLGFIEGSGVGFYYDNHFMIKEVSLNQFSAVFKTKRGGFGLNVGYFGYGQYNEKKVGLAYGMKLGKRFALGVQMDYLHTFIAENYGSKSMLSFEIGLMTKITDELTLGAHIFNPIRTQISEYNDERIPTILKLGLNWDLSKDFTAAIEAESDMNNPLMLRAGLEYNIMDLMYARIGVSNNPNVFSFGVGLYLGGFKLDFSSSMHQILGYSPQISASYLF